MSKKVRKTRQKQVTKYREDGTSYVEVVPEVYYENSSYDSGSSYSSYDSGSSSSNSDSSSSE